MTIIVRGHENVDEKCLLRCDHGTLHSNCMRSEQHRAGESVQSINGYDELTSGKATKSHKQIHHCELYLQQHSSSLKLWQNKIYLNSDD